MSQTIQAGSRNNVTVRRARQILGNKAENLSDKQIEIILRSLYALCEKVVKEVTKI